MRYRLILLFIFVSTSLLIAQNTVKMSAVKANDYGVAYSLPKTSIVIDVTYTKVTRTAGEFYQYADRYLNVSTPITENNISYNIDNIEANAKGIVDKDKSYLLEFKAGSSSAYATLTKDGLICAVNDEYSFPEEQIAKKTVSQVSETIDPKMYLSEEILRAGSSAKQAELIAKQIYRLRESRTNILTGEADNMPPDGNAYKLIMDQIDTQEKALTAMFVGNETVETYSKQFTVIPDTKDIEGKVIFRFSNKLGVVDANDLAGSPVYLSLTNLNPIDTPILTAKEAKSVEEKFSKGVIYNIPNIADLKITYKGKTYVNKELDVVQYGTQEVLASKLFENNKKPIKVIFYPEQGSIKQIIE